MLGLTAWADGPTNGELSWGGDGTPYKIGQPTTDHLFVRGTVQGAITDNVVAFDEGDTKLVWFWLDDDAIYNNAKVQSLTPIPYNASGSLYNEITYNSFQCDLYLPEGMRLISYEDDAGEERTYYQGDRMPTMSNLVYQENDGTKVIDGVTYHSYTLICYNASNYGSHLSAKNAVRYQNNGALKKDDAPVMGLLIKTDNPLTGSMPDMIIANLEFGFREAFTNEPRWEPNDYIFFYGTGGNNTTQVFQYYQRVHLQGSDPGGGEELPTGNTLTVPASLTAQSGRNFDLPVALANESPISALQCDIVLPDGFELARDNNGNFMVDVNGERMSEGHTLSTRQLADGSVRVLIASPDAKPFIGNTGDLFTLHVYVNGDVVDGIYPVSINNIVVADVNAVTYDLAAAQSLVEVRTYAKGDANGDDVVNVGDYVTTVNYIMEMNPEPFFFTAADVDDNETINVGDLVGITNLIFTAPKP